MFSTKLKTHRTLENAVLKYATSTRVLRAEDDAQQKLEKAILGDAVDAPNDDENVKNHLRPGRKFVYYLSYRVRDHSIFPCG